MTARDQPDSRGGAAIGVIDDLPALEAGAVMCLRHWSEGRAAQSRMRGDFAAALGVGHGQAALQALSELCDLCARHGRRPLMRHGLTCRCLGADEAWFARLIGAAAEGAREDALMIGTALMRPDLAPCLAGLAETLGLALRRMLLRPDAAPFQPMATPAQEKAPRVLH